jgi:cytochrome c
MLIKAAWREVETPEEERRFYVSDACVCDGGVNGPPTNCQKRRMALVGLHIIQRTPTAPQWIWTTFEQLDNVADPGATAPYSFFKPACVGCVPNQQTPAGTPAQLTRRIPIPSAEPDCSRPDQSIDNVQLMNRNVAEALRRAGSVFRSYQLVGAQRPLPPTAERPTTAFTATPAMLANTTMESYVQTTSSCIGCHATARTTNPNEFASSHFTFQLNNAQPKPANTTVLQLPVGPLQPDVLRGKELAEHTYELLPASVPYAKLHCTSCHLDGGRNSTAAWWVDLQYAYPTRESLEARINRCFQQSMNGKPLCTPGANGTCGQNRDMRSIISYMDFLTSIYVKVPPTPHGFPAVKTLTGDYCSGKATFAQKCAVCHQEDGQGRYNNGIYYRPALWGPQSFNHNAGMFSDPMLLVQFVSWNMPYGAGGLVTDQEAWDLEVFIDSHERPGLTPLGPPIPTCGE